MQLSKGDQKLNAITIITHRTNKSNGIVQVLPYKSGTLFEKYHKHILLFYQHSILIAREKSHKRRSLFFQFPIKGTLLLVLRRILFWFFLFLPLAACFCCFGQPFFSWLQSFFYFLFFFVCKLPAKHAYPETPKAPNRTFRPVFQKWTARASLARDFNDTALKI